MLHARRECATHAEVVFDVLKMMCDISAAFEYGLRWFARIFGAEVRRFRLKIARFCMRLGAILERTAHASTAKRVQSSLVVDVHPGDQVSLKNLNVRCVPREKLPNLWMKIARVWVGFCRVFACSKRAASAPRTLKWFLMC